MYPKTSKNIPKDQKTTFSDIFLQFLSKCSMLVHSLSNPGPQALRAGFGGAQEGPLREKLIFFQILAIYSFFRVKNTRFQANADEICQLNTRSSTRIHLTRVLCCDTAFYSGYHLIIAILVNFGQLGLFWAISQKPKKILHHFLFFSAFQTPMDQERIPNI